MPKIEYKEHKFRKSTLALIKQANEIIDEYMAQGHVLTLRQLGYQFVSRDLYANSGENYERLGRVVKDARLAGLIDWSAIVDRTRRVQGNVHFDSPKDLLLTAQQQYKIDTRQDQDVYVEVWVEKDALIGVIEPVCRELDVPYFACRGNVSESALWQAAYYRFSGQDRQIIILHMGDHDPSGLLMTEDNQNRLNQFRSHAEVRRIALNMDQVNQYNLPPNPTKEADKNTPSYIAKYGVETCWELDALDIKVIENLIRVEVDGLTDHDKRQEQIDRQCAEKLQLAIIAENYNEG